MFDRSGFISCLFFSRNTRLFRLKIQKPRKIDGWVNIDLISIVRITHNIIFQFFDENISQLCYIDSYNTPSNSKRAQLRC